MGTLRHASCLCHTLKAVSTWVFVSFYRYVCISCVRDSSILLLARLGQCRCKRVNHENLNGRPWATMGVRTPGKPRQTGSPVVLSSQNGGLRAFFPGLGPPLLVYPVREYISKEPPELRGTRRGLMYSRYRTHRKLRKQQ